MKNLSLYKLYHYTAKYKMSHQDNQLCSLSRYWNQHMSCKEEYTIHSYYYSLHYSIQSDNWEDSLIEIENIQLHKIYIHMCLCNLSMEIGMNHRWCSKNYYNLNSISGDIRWGNYFEKVILEYMKYKKLHYSHSFHMDNGKKYIC